MPGSGRGALDRAWGSLMGTGLGVGRSGQGGRAYAEAARDSTAAGDSCPSHTHTLMLRLRDSPAFSAAGLSQASADPTAGYPEQRTNQGSAASAGARNTRVAVCPARMPGISPKSAVHASHGATEP